MRVYTLVAQRRSSYPGEHAPEIIDACDEWAWDENPMGYMDEKEKAARASGEFTATRLFITMLDDDYVDGHLNPVDVPPDEYDFVAAGAGPSR